jgi:hypothetical protein
MLWARPNQESEHNRIRGFRHSTIWDPLGNLNVTRTRLNPRIAAGHKELTKERPSQLEGRHPGIPCRARGPCLVILLTRIRAKVSNLTCSMLARELARRWTDQAGCPTIFPEN